MIKRTITYKDYDGNERTEDFYFNLNKAEITEMEVSKEGGLTRHITNLIRSQNPKEIIAIFKLLILASFGVKSEDGRRFIKSQELRNEFEQTEAYVSLFTELANDTEAATAFVNGIIPQPDAKAN